MDPKNFTKEQFDDDGDDVQSDNIDRLTGDQGKSSLKPKSRLRTSIEEDSSVDAGRGQGSERPDIQKIPLV